MCHFLLFIKIFRNRTIHTYLVFNLYPINTFLLQFIFSF